MYNLNVNLAASAATAAGSLLVESTCTTPRTPEILNSLIAMSNPLDNYQFGDDAPKLKHSGMPTNASTDSNSSCSSQVESPTSNPPSVQHTCSQLIKAGLKLTIEQKRKHLGDCEDLLDLDSAKRFKKSDCGESEDDKIKQETNGLTPEDEERRRRRRERNKIAATKCRLKKRERTANLIHESEILETQNIDLKNQLHELQNQKRRLEEVLTMHRPQCQHNIGPATRDSLYKLPPVSSVMETHSYSRPSTVNTSYRYHDLEIFNRSPNGATTHTTYSRNSTSFSKPPSIIVDDIGDYDSSFTNLDSPYSFDNCHNYNGTHNYNQGLDNGCMA